MNEFTISLTEKAANMIYDVFKENEVTDPYLAVYVAGGGCSGLQYGLAIAEGEPEIDDVIVYDKNIKIAVDVDSAKYLNGALVDYDDKGMMSGFKVENPNAVKGCGCGKSFSVGGEEIDSCGSCGYN